MKIEEICRTCLSESSDLRSIFKLGVIAGKTTTLSRVLMEFTKLTIKESDCFPDKMCYGCVIQANQSFAFLQTCLESDRYLREKLTAKPTKISSNSRTNECNDESTMTEAETQTVYLYNAINIEGENEINVHIEPSEIKVIKNETPLACSAEHSNDGEDGEILLTSEETMEQNQHESETVVPDIIEDDNLETEILEEIENEGGNSNSSYEHIQNHEYFHHMDEDENNDEIKHEKNIDEEISFVEHDDENDVSIEEIFRVESNNERISDEGKRKRKTRSYMSKLNVSGPPYICSICQKQLSTKSSLRYHMQLHSDATPFLCNECGEGYKTRNAYEGHMTTHMNPHKCDVCGKTYRQANSLKTHMLTHTGEKPFLCGICGKGMTQKSGFKKHLLVHSGEMPFECEVCHKRFRYSSNLIAHKKTHMEKKENNHLSCKTCSKLCNTPSELKKHVNTHKTITPQNTSSCPICGKFFTKIEALGTHIKLMHKQDIEKRDLDDNSSNSKNTILIE